MAVKSFTWIKTSHGRLIGRVWMVMNPKANRINTHLKISHKIQEWKNRVVWAEMELVWKKTWVEDGNLPHIGLVSEAYARTQCDVAWPIALFWKISPTYLFGWAVLTSLSSKLHNNESWLEIKGMFEVSPCEPSVVLWGRISHGNWGRCLVRFIFYLSLCKKIMPGLGDEVYEPTKILPEWWISEYQ